MCEPIDDLCYGDFAAIFGDCLEEYLEVAGIQFGDPSFDWCASAAEELRAIAHEEGR